MLSSSGYLSPATTLALPSIHTRTILRLSFASTMTPQDIEIMIQQLGLLSPRTGSDELSEINTAPLFTYPVLKHAQNLATTTSAAAFSQYGLLGGDARYLQETSSEDPRIFYNVATPASVFICGSQGSGKSHTLSCILENCLIPSDKLGCLPRPLTGIVFHYDDYASDSRVNPCEAAYLGSNGDISVRVLCSPTNIRAIKVIIPSTFYALFRSLM